MRWPVGFGRFDEKSGTSLAMLGQLASARREQDANPWRIGAGQKFFGHAVPPRRRSPASGVRKPDFVRSAHDSRSTVAGVVGQFSTGRKYRGLELVSRARPAAATWHGRAVVAVDSYYGEACQKKNSGSSPALHRGDERRLRCLLRRLMLMRTRVRSYVSQISRIAYSTA